MGTGPLKPTTRGLAVGVAAAVLVLGGLVLGRREAVAIGLFLAALLAASLAALAVHAHLARRTRLVRTVSPQDLVAGSDVRVTFSGVVPGLRDGLPGRAPVPVPAGGYRWTAPRRGVYDIGPALTHLCGPFGLWTGSAPVTATSRVRVLPQPLDDEALDGVLRAGTGEHDAADLLGSEAAPDDLLVRDHRDGDALTRVHWGATARTGRLMVRQEEWAHDPWTVVVLDCRAVSFATGRHRVDGGAGRAWTTSPPFERAVSLAAAVIERLHSSGHQVLLVDQDGNRLEPELAAAVLEPALREAAWPSALPPQATTVIALLGTAAGQDVPVMVTLPRTLHRVALLFGAGEAGPAALAGPAAALEQDGWLVAEVRP
ncbi:MAG: hypothetical protein MOP51_1175 [Citricoccus sp.]|jgi:uncharacterized protein (DUF58 family)|nr:hypothetical protein [Citricoccus sp. WCRC_4]